MNSTYLLTIVLSLLVVSYVSQYAGADPGPITLFPPTNLLASPVSDSEIDLSWIAPSNVSGISIAGYMIERSTDGGSTWSTIVDNTQSADTTYQDTDVVIDTTYTYRVSAITVLLVSQPSNTATVTLQSTTSKLTVKSQDYKGNALPGFYVTASQNGNLQGSGYTQHVFKLNNNENYVIEIDSKYGKYAFDRWQDTGSASNSRTISISSDSTIVAVYDTVPQKPTGLTATAVSDSQINLNWNAPADDGGSKITGYRISRSLDGGATWSAVISNTNSASTAYSDTGLDPSIMYNYRVFAINSVGASTASDISSATTANPITTPQPPTGLVATTVSSSKINLSWSAPTDNGGSAITGYKIERSVNNTATWIVVISNTNSATTTYSDTGLVPSTTYTYRVSAINVVGISNASSIASATTQNEIRPITQVGSGLVVTDSLTNETKTQQQLQNFSRYWVFGGDAPAFGAKYDFFKNPQGLHIGAETKTNGTWAGYFAVSPNTNATLFHAVITAPLRSIPHDYFENGMYIQTSQPFINYVTCTSVTGQLGTVWAVVSTIGNATQANQFNVLYVDTSDNQPLTRDCTLITNGDNYLKVYFDGTLAYSSNTLNLQMPGPFNTYLEPQSAYHDQLLNGTYTDYYATTNEIVKITNITSNVVRADLVDSTGKILASSHPSNGIASFDVGKYDFPLAASIKAYDANNILVASTSGAVKIYGGDVYASR